MNNQLGDDLISLITSVVLEALGTSDNSASLEKILSSVLAPPPSPRYPQQPQQPKREPSRQSQGVRVRVNPSRQSEGIRVRVNPSRQSEGIRVTATRPSEGFNVARLARPCCFGVGGCDGDLHDILGLDLPPIGNFDESVTLRHQISMLQKENENLKNQINRLRECLGNFAH